MITNVAKVDNPVDDQQAVLGFMPTRRTAARFVELLQARSSPDQLEKIRKYFKATDDTFIGVRMGIVFDLAKANLDMPIDEIERLLESPIHEARAGALSIMDKLARAKRTPDDVRKELYELYLRRLDRIDNWDLVDVGAPWVVGRYLFDKPRDVLYELAGSTNLWARRTALLSALYFVRQGEVDDAFALAEMQVYDEEDLVRKPVGGLLRDAGKKDPRRLGEFLDRYAATMPRTALRYAIERLGPEEREYYLKQKHQTASPRHGVRNPPRSPSPGNPMA